MCCKVCTWTRAKSASIAFVLGPLGCIYRVSIPLELSLSLAPY